MSLASCRSSSLVERRGRYGYELGREVPKESYSLRLGAAILEARGEHAEAEAAYLEALEADPESDEAHAGWIRMGCARLHAAVSRRAGERSESREDLVEQRFEASPKGPSSVRARGECAFLWGDLVQAKHYAWAALALAPLDARATELLIRLARTEGHETDVARLEMALHLTLEGAPRAKPERFLESEEAEAERARLAYRKAAARGDVEGALQHAARIATRSELALRLWVLGYRDSARTLAEQILRLDPANGDASLLLLLASASSSPNAQLRSLSHWGFLVLSIELGRTESEALAQEFWRKTEPLRSAQSASIAAFREDPLVVELMGRWKIE